MWSDGCMENLPPHISPEAFLIHVFSAKAVRDGKIVRRSLRDIERYIGRDRFVKELHRRGFFGLSRTRDRWSSSAIASRSASCATPFSPAKTGRKKAGFSGPELPAIPVTSHRRVTRNLIPSRDRTVRNATGTGSAPATRSNRNLRRNSASRSGPSIIAKPRAGTNPRAHRERDIRLAADKPCRFQSSNAPDRTRPGLSQSR